MKLTVALKADGETNTASVDLPAQAATEQHLVTNAVLQAVSMQMNMLGARAFQGLTVTIED